LLAGERDAKRLADVCERLAKTATATDYEPALDAAFALRYIQDPVAIPYLDRVITKADWRLRGLAVTGLGRIGTPEAVDVLKSHLNTSDQTLRSEIEVALWEIKTGLKVQVLD
jgi:HEAT repeat protein